MNTLHFVEIETSASWVFKLYSCENRITKIVKDTQN